MRATITVPSFAVAGQPPRAGLVQGGQQEPGEVAEVIEDQGLVEPCGPGDGPSACPRVALGLEGLDGGIHQPGPCVLSGPGPRRPCAWLCHVVNECLKRLFRSYGSV